MRDFMLAQTRESDLELFVALSADERPETVDDVPTYVVIPGFIVSELKTAFQMGFIIFVPFLVIDIVVSSALLSMGMMMLPPAVISLPFKISALRSRRRLEPDSSGLSPRALPLLEVVHDRRSCHGNRTGRAHDRVHGLGADSHRQPGDRSRDLDLPGHGPRSTR